MAYDPDEKPRRYMCERCGGTGIEPEGHWTGKAYDSVGGGLCTLCEGEGKLGVIQPSRHGIFSEERG